MQRLDLRALSSTGELYPDISFHVGLHCRPFALVLLARRLEFRLKPFVGYVDLT